MTLLARPNAARTIYWAIWVLCTGLTCAVIFVPEYLPMVDLPQHAGQIAIWLDWNDADLRYQQVYRQAPLPPAIVATALSFALAHVMSVEMALKVVIAITTLTVPVVVHFLVKEVSGDPWWVFLTFPIGFGYSFGFGFINFCLGVPVALFLTLLAIRYSARPSGSLAASLFFTTLALFAIHAIAFGFGILVAVSIIVARSPGFRIALVRTTPILLVLPLALVWLMAVHQAEPAVRTPPDFRLGVYRLLVLPPFLIGERLSPIAYFLGLLMSVAPFAYGARPSTQLWRCILLVVSVTLFLGAPHVILGTGFIYQRFAVFVIPGLLLALDWPSKPRTHLDRSCVIAPAIALVLLLGVGFRFWRFNVEAAGVDAILTQIPRGARLLYLPIERQSSAVPFPVYLHFGMWHQVRQGGVTDFSFARFPMNRFRYCDNASPPLPHNFEFTPELFDWEQHWGEAFDYFLVRAFEDSRTLLFKEAVDRVTLVDRQGAWWLFRRVPSQVRGVAERGNSPRLCAN